MRGDLSVERHHQRALDTSGMWAHGSVSFNDRLDGDLAAARTCQKSPVLSPSYKRYHRCVHMERRVRSIPFASASFTYVYMVSAGVTDGRWRALIVLGVGSGRYRRRGMRCNRLSPERACAGDVSCVTEPAPPDRELFCLPGLRLSIRGPSTLCPTACLTRSRGPDLSSRTSRLWPAFADGIVLQESDVNVYAMLGGAGAWVLDASVFFAGSYQRGNTNRVAGSSLADVPSGPDVSGPPCSELTGPTGCTTRSEVIYCPDDEPVMRDNHSAWLSR